MSRVVLVQEWDSDAFHRKVAELEAQGYEALRETYRIVAETHPETGVISHLHSIEMRKPEPGEG
ncbi:MAG: hypothetical protein HY656_05455 [Acidobacteria bacterium]|nr:hypothetical protein [Acidobacteriota bacterium]